MHSNGTKMDRVSSRAFLINERYFSLQGSMIARLPYFIIV